MPVLITGQSDNRITPKEAYELYQTSYERKQVEQLKKVYSAIRDAATYQTHLVYVIDGYLVKMEAVSSNCDDYRYRLTISWAGEAQIDPNKKYILPMEGTTSHNIYGDAVTKYALLGSDGNWDILAAFGNQDAADGMDFIVTAKDLEDAPEWVKAIEPVEVM